MDQDLYAPDGDQAADNKQADRADSGQVTLEQAHEWRRQSLAHYADTIREGEEDLAFVDGEQWEAKAKRDNTENDKPSLVFNRVAVAVQVATALERTQRQDIIALPRGSSDVQLAEVATQIIRYVCDQNDVDHRVSRSFEWAMKFGIGWIKQTRSDLLMKEQIQVKAPDPRHVFLDPWSRDDDISDARFVLERVIMPLGDAKRMYRKFAKEFDRLQKSMAYKPGAMEDVDRNSVEVDGQGTLTAPVQFWDDEDGKGAIDVAKGMVTVYELTYKVIEDATVLCLPDGSYQEIDPDNDDDVRTVYEALTSNQGAEVKVGPVEHFRRKVFCGPIEIVDESLDRSYSAYPFIPVWCYRDRLGRPISLVRFLKDPQREINYRHSSMIGILGSQQVLMEEGAVQDEDELAENINRPNGIIRLNPGGLERLKIERQTDIAPLHFQMEQQAAAYIDQISGVNQDLRGDKSDAKTGVAIKARQSQGALQLYPLMDQLRMSKRLLGERIVAEYTTLYKAEKEIRITENTGDTSFLRFNVQDPAAQQMAMQQAQANGVKLKAVGSLDAGRFDLKVDQAPSNPTERARQAETLLALAGQIGSTDPIASYQMVILAVANSDLPAKDQLLQTMNQRLQAMLQPAEPKDDIKEIINYKDAPEDIRRQMEAKEGYQPSQIPVGMPGNTRDKAAAKPATQKESKPQGKQATDGQQPNAPQPYDPGY